MEAGKSQDLQAGDSGEPTVWFQSGSEWARDPGRAKFQLESKGRIQKETDVPTQAGRQPKSPLTQAFCSSQVFN